MPTMAELTVELNCRATHHPIGRLQEIRQEIKRLARPRTRQLFTSQTTMEDYAFHDGGRTELQFNIGFEVIDGEEYVRHGVAFSLEPSQTLPDITPLIPKISRFNEFLRNYPDEFGDLRMWHYVGGIRSSNYPPTSILPDIVTLGAFIFLGRLQPLAHPDCEVILNDFDRLLQLYQYVQTDNPYPTITEPGGSFQFVPGCPIKPSVTVASLPQRELDIQLRHNELQRALYGYLEKRYGEGEVGTELGTGIGTRIDAVVRHGDHYWFYEIKTALSARACIREAMAQLLEYAFWPGAQEAERLIIVGEAILNADTHTFLARLRDRFSLPIYYQQFDMQIGTLIE